MDEDLFLAHREPDQQTQSHIQPQGYRKSPLQVRISARPALALLRLRLNPHSSPLLQWCTGEDSNLRSSKERQIYSLLPLTARPPVPNQNPTYEDLSARTLNHSPQRQKNRHQEPCPTLPAHQRTHSSASTPVRRISGTSEHAPRVGSPPRTGPALKKTHRPMLTASGPASWLPRCGADGGI
jgi:hypothetical protein